jgi:predicted nucleic acid-binding protein
MPGSDDSQLVYWDACVLIALVNEEAGRIEHLTALMADADDGRLSVITSTASVTEVAYATNEKAQGVLDDAVYDRIETLWTPASPVRLVDFHLGLARRSRDLIRESVAQARQVKPMDAIHLATAESMSVAKFHTYDLQRLQPWGPTLGFAVEEPTSDRPQLPV